MTTPDTALEYLIEFAAARLRAATHIMAQVQDMDDPSPPEAMAVIVDVRQVLKQVEQAFRLIDAGSTFGWPEPPPPPDVSP